MAIQIAVGILIAAFIIFLIFLGIEIQSKALPGGQFGDFLFILAILISAWLFYEAFSL